MSPTKKKDSEMDDLISIAEAARIRGVTHGAIRNLIDRGRLPAQEVAGRRVVSRADVLDFSPDKGGRPSKPKEEAEKSVAKKRIRKKDPTRLLKTLS